MKAAEDNPIVVSPEERVSNKWYIRLLNGAHFILPRTRDLDILTTQLLSTEILSESEIEHRGLKEAPAITWGESLTVSGIFIALLLGLSCWRFATKDY